MKPPACYLIPLLALLLFSQKTFGQNISPIARAGDDRAIKLPVNYVTLKGNSSTDADGTITKYAWSKVSGPAAGKINNPGATTTVISALAEGVYTFRLTVTDNNQATASDDVVITVKAATGTNTPPVANAGPDQTIILPTNSAALNGSNSTDANGTITQYAWAKYSGPAAGSLVNAGTANATATGLTEGAYIFRLTVTDNGLATATDDVVITVKANLTSFHVVDFRSNWKYLDNGSNQGTAWRAITFNDAAWPTGSAQLGYGDDDEATTVGYGGNSNNKYITTYFRKQVNIVNPAAYSNFTLNLKRDDGAVVYINGTEVFRSNMPAGTVSNTTLASISATDDGNTIQTATIASNKFVNGNNTIAVEMHQNAANSSDLSFDLELSANITGSPLLTRGPYLQMASTSAVTLRWRTNLATNSRINVGTVTGNYNLSATNNTVATEHEVRITGLQPDTKYFYSFGSSTQTLAASANHFFTTAPPANTTRKIRVAAFGDCGINTNHFQSATLNAYQNYVGSNPAELMLLLGDNAYQLGTDEEYSNNFFGAYSGNILKNHIVFPSPGNHDYASLADRQADHNIPYYTNFTMPTAAECGGVASGTEYYYSYNWGNIHFISLDSYGTETASKYRLYDTTSPQVVWLKKDLAANTSRWTVAYWHHPPYTMGSHTSDTETELKNIRQNFIRILERYGVDMVVCGHSHNYERSYLLKGHFGNEASFNVAAHAASSSSAKYDGSGNSCPYNTASGKVNHGTVYVVAGSSGADGGVQSGFPHNALPFSVDDGGMLYFEVENTRLDAKFIRRDGVIADKFTILKDAGKTTTINASSGASTTLTASWTGNYVWSNGATTKSITVNPASTTSYTCTDGSACITDNFSVVVTPTFSPMMANAIPTAIADKNNTWVVVPTLVKRGNPINIIGYSSMPVTMAVLNDKGQKIKQFVVKGTTAANTDGMRAGMYFIRAIINQKIEVRKILVTD